MSDPYQQPSLSLEEALEELEAIVSAIEAGELNFEESLTQYQRGQLLIQYCRSVLEEAQQRLDQAPSPHADGQEPLHPPKPRLPGERGGSEASDPRPPE